RSHIRFKAVLVQLPVSGDCAGSRLRYCVGCPRTPIGEAAEADLAGAALRPVPGHPSTARWTIRRAQEPTSCVVADPGECGRDPQLSLAGKLRVPSAGRRVADRGGARGLSSPSGSGAPGQAEHVSSLVRGHAGTNAAIAGVNRGITSRLLIIRTFRCTT